MIFFKNNRIISTVLLLIIFVSLVGCRGGKENNEYVLKDIEILIDTSRTIDVQDTIQYNPIGNDIALEVETESSLRKLNSITKKILKSSNKKNEDIIYDDYFYIIRFGSYLIEYQGNASLYKIDESGNKTLIKEAYHADEAIADEVHELIQNVKAQTKQ